MKSSIAHQHPVCKPLNLTPPPDYFTNPYDLWDADSAKST